MSELGRTSELATLIEAQLGICDEMITLSEREQQALTLLKPAQLPELLAAQDDCAARLTRAQEALDVAVRTAADGIGLAGGDGRGPDVCALLPHLPLEARQRLESLRSALEERAYTLAVLNAQNALLVRTGLLQMRQAAAVLSSALGESPSYGAGGAVRMPTANSTLLLNRQV